MSNFVDDNTTLPTGKVDATPVISGEEATHVAAAEWNGVMQDLYDLRGGIKRGKVHGLYEVTEPTAPTNYGVVFFLRDNGVASPNKCSELCAKFSDGTVIILGQSGLR